MFLFVGFIVVSACGPAPDSPQNSEATTASSDGVEQATHQDALELERATDEQLAAYSQFFEDNKDAHLQQVAELVAFPTLAMIPENAPDLEKAGQYLVERITEIGMENAAYHPAGGFPLVTAEWMQAEGQPTVVFYGHFDVQPVVPERWDSDPFNAEIRDNKMYGRGATDDKGYIIAFLSTLEAMMKLDGGLPVNVKLFLDGSE